MESAKENSAIRMAIQWRAIRLIDVYYRVVLHLWWLHLCLLLVLITLLQIADMYIICKSMCCCNLLNCIPNPYDYISLIDTIYIVYAWNIWSWKDRWFSCNKWTKFIIISINRKFVWYDNLPLNLIYKYFQKCYSTIMILKYTRFISIFSECLLQNFITNTAKIIKNRNSILPSKHIEFLS